MSASQQHGFEVERIILADMSRRARLGKKVPLSQSYVSRFDAPGYSDPYSKGIPTSIKTAKKQASGDALICMADATRIGQLADVSRMRLLVALYEQKGTEKVFSEIREYIITSTDWKKAMGDVSAETLEMFSAEIKAQTDPTAARQVAREWKEVMAEEYPSVMRWNPKIDSKGQRRLQCSIHLRDLEALIKDPKRIRIFGTTKGAVSPRLWGNGTLLPIRLSSPPRQRTLKTPAKKKKSSPSASNTASRRSARR